MLKKAHFIRRGPKHCCWKKSNSAQVMLAAFCISVQKPVHSVSLTNSFTVSLDSSISAADISSKTSIFKIDRF